MNWYKKNQYEYYLYKYSWDWKKFLLPIMIPLVPMLVYLGISPQEANNIANKNNNDTAAIKQQLQSMISKKDTQPAQTHLRHTENKINEIPGDKKETVVEKTNISQDYKPFADNLIPYEGIREYVYNDGKGLPTIGIGHLITPKSHSIFKNLFNISDQEYNDIVNKKRKLTKDQIYKLFYNYDLKEHINRAKSRLPKFDTYPEYLKVALVNAIYRGDLGKNTAQLINSGNWVAASKEYIKHKDYNSPNPRLKGITPRMDKNQKAMLQYAKEIGQI